MEWGPWKLNSKTLCLVHRDGYEVGLGSCKSSASILDWIFQIQGKTWADSDTLVNLLNAIDDVLHPQENYCSGGSDHEADGKELAQTYLADPGARDRAFSELLGDDK